MPRKKKTDEAPADGAVEQDNAPGSPDEDAAPQAASSESDVGSETADDRGSESDETDDAEAEAQEVDDDIPSLDEIDARAFAEWQTGGVAGDLVPGAVGVWTAAIESRDRHRAGLLMSDTIDGDAEQVLFDSLAGLAVRQDAELRLLRAAVEPFAAQVEKIEGDRGPAFSRSNTVPISLGRLADLRDAARFRALAPVDANDEAILEAAQPVEAGT